MRAGCGTVGGWRALWIAVWVKAQTAVRVVVGDDPGGARRGRADSNGRAFSGPEAVSEWLRSGFEAIFARKYDGGGGCG